MAPTHTEALRRIAGSEAWHAAAKRAVAVGVAAGTHSVVSRRGLTVSDTQKVTLGVIAGYIVAIALLWNLPYVRWVLWPFKVSHPPSSNNSRACPPTCIVANLQKDARHSLPRVQPRHGRRPHRRARQVHLARPSRGRSDAHAGRQVGDHAAGGLPRVVADRGAADVLRVRHRRQQGRQHRAGRVLPADAVVGAQGLAYHRYGVAGCGVAYCVLVY